MGDIADPVTEKNREKKGEGQRQVIRDEEAASVDHRYQTSRERGIGISASPDRSSRSSCIRQSSSAMCPRGEKNRM